MEKEAAESDCQRQLSDIRVVVTFDTHGYNTEESPRGDASATASMCVTHSSEFVDKT